jgi:pyridoxal phosphate enzyme (YggS family)
MPNFAERLESIKNNITAACLRSDRNPDDVKLVVVTKTADAENINEVAQLGYAEFGENRVTHLKQVSSIVNEFIAENVANPLVPDKVNWHMIGHLQRNKVRTVLKTVSLIHSVDTLRLAEEINTVAGKLGLRPDVLVQVNCSGEPQKYGAPVGAAIHLVEQLLTMPNLTVKGLMTMAPLTRDKQLVRASFARAKEIFDEIETSGVVGREFTELSMGMSQDYEIAIEEGATILRVGSAVFAG